MATLIVCHIQPGQVRCLSPLAAESRGPVAPRQLGGPGGVGAVGPQGVLEAAVEPLNHAVGLWMVGCGWPVLNLK